MVRDVRWDARTAGGWTAELAGGEVAIVNLAGRLVDARPTPATIADLTRSRVEATRALVTASRDLDRPLRRWVQASTTAIWSDAGEERLDESSPIPIGLPQMTGVAEQWERALDGAHSDHTAILRTGVVLEANTPALDRLLLLAELGLGGPVGTGRQWVSWIHVRDWVRIVLTALGLEGPELPAGVVVASAPHPVRNAELMRILRRAVGQRIGLPTPAPVLRLGALLLRTRPDRIPVRAPSSRRGSPGSAATASFSLNCGLAQLPLEDPGRSAAPSPLCLVSPSRSAAAKEERPGPSARRDRGVPRDVEAIRPRRRERSRPRRRRDRRSRTSARPGRPAHAPRGRHRRHAGACPGSPHRWWT